MRVEAHVKLTLAITLTLTLTFQWHKYQHVGFVELYPLICSLWRSDTAAFRVFRVFCSVP